MWCGVFSCKLVQRGYKNTMHRVRDVRLRLGYECVSFICTSYSDCMMIRWWWTCTLRYSDASYPCSFVFHMLKERTLFAWYSFRVLYDCVSFNTLYQYSSSESLSFSSQSLSCITSMDQRPETSTFSQWFVLFTSPAVFHLSSHIDVLMLQTGFRGTYSRSRGSSYSETSHCLDWVIRYVWVEPLKWNASWMHRISLG